MAGAAVLAALDAVVKADDSRAAGLGEGVGEGDDAVGGEAGHSGDMVRRVLGKEGVGAELFGTKGAAAKVARVFQAIAEEDVHEAQGEENVGAGADGEVLVGEGGGAGAIGIDNDEAGAGATGLLDEGPEVDVVAVDVGAPRNDEAGVREVLRTGAEARAVDAHHAGAAGAGADGAVKLRRAEAMEEAAIHGAVAELADGAGVAVGQNALGAVFCGDRGEAGGDLAEGDVPGDAFKRGEFLVLRERALGDAGAAAQWGRAGDRGRRRGRDIWRLCRRGSRE